MRAVDLIIKKRDGLELTKEEIGFFVAGLTSGEIPDYQVSAWAMAVLWRGMTVRETTDLTLAMAHSGEMLDLSGVVKFVVDKHSTGGVGDKTTLVVEPVVAACGVPVGKMSGRGLGFSGGTLDKMESIPGFRATLTREEFVRQLKDIGLVLCGQTGELAPADGKLYALRDVTGTVPALPLIASSVMSKKIAAGAQGIVLDVKVGLGAFMPTVEEATRLAQLMVGIGKRAGRRMVALVSDMNQPLGCAVGNALEVREAIDTLKGGGPTDFREHCLEVAAHLLMVAGAARSITAARGLAVARLEDGSAAVKFRALIARQGGAAEVVDHPQLLPAAPLHATLLAARAGHVAQANARVIGESAVALGAGRAKKGDPIDPAVGILMKVKVGDRVSAGDPLCEVHARTQVLLDQALTQLPSAFIISSRRVESLPLFYKTIRG
ncbi:MAG TPA: thymidine phosphorylase [Anaerolineales bacterium]|nr:thymidine phosphorylase [Anaerolineales bacterium]